MAKKVKCENKDCKDKTKYDLTIRLFEGESVYCGTCGSPMPVTEE